MIFVLLLAVCSPANSESFAPDILKIVAPKVVQYTFDKSTLHIPIIVEGTTASGLFLIFTGNKGIGINGIATGAVEFVVMQRIESEEILFDRVMKNDKAFLSFINPDVAQVLCLFLRQSLAEKDLLGEWVSKALNHDAGL